MDLPNSDAGDRFAVEALNEPLTLRFRARASRSPTPLSLRREPRWRIVAAQTRGSQ
jgi:hypothetical protein